MDGGGGVAAADVLPAPDFPGLAEEVGVDGAVLGGAGDLVADTGRGDGVGGGVAGCGGGRGDGWWV